MSIKAELFTQAYTQYRELRKTVAQMDRLVIELAGHPDTQEGNLAEWACALARHKADMRKRHAAMTQASLVHGSFKQKTWLALNQPA